MKQEQIWFKYGEQEFSPNDYTEYGEPQLWLYLSDGTSIEVTQEQEGLKEEEYYFSVRHHCSDEDYDNGFYKSTCGIIDTAVFSNIGDLREYLRAMLRAWEHSGVHLD